jgi:hypothetical protein
MEYSVGEETPSSTGILPRTSFLNKQIIIIIIILSSVIFWQQQ